MKTGVSIPAIRNNKNIHLDLVDAGDIDILLLSDEDKIKCIHNLLYVNFQLNKQVCLLKAHYNIFEEDDHKDYLF